MEDLKILFGIVGMLVLVVLVFLGIIHAGTGYTTPNKVFTACNTTGYWQYEQKRIKCEVAK